MNLYEDAGLLILGTRMKRLSERFLSEVSRVYKEQKIHFEPAWFPIVFLLDKHGPLSLTEISNALDVSHSAISQMISQLQTKKIVENVPTETDGRVKRIYFTPKGLKLVSQVRPVWQALNTSLSQLLPDVEKGQFIGYLIKMEGKIGSGDLANQTLHLLNSFPLEIVCREADDASREKLMKWMNGEGCDISILSGSLLVAYVKNEPAGIVAYNADTECIELNYIFVSPDFRRQGVASRLLETLFTCYLNQPGGFFKMKEPNMDILKLLIKLNYSFKVK